MRMRQSHNAQLANFDVTSLRVTSATTTQQDVQSMRDEATSKAMISAREKFLKEAKSQTSRISQN